MTQQQQQRRLLTLKGLPKANLPPFPSSSSSPPSDLAPFLITLLLESLPLLDSIPTSSPTTSSSSSSESTGEWRHLTQKKYPSSSDAPVDLYERSILVGDEGKEEEETWALRRSVHSDDGVTGKTASWEEFWVAFKEKHVECEGEYMPSVVAAEVLGSWTGEEGEMGVESTEQSKTYTNFTLDLAAMRHRIGRPILQDRVFPILQMTCAVQTSSPSPSPSSPPAQDQEQQQQAQPQPQDPSPKHHESENYKEIIIITIPIPDLFTPNPPQSQSPNPIQNINLQGKINTKNTTIGLYASVERFRRIEEGKKIEWVMATASDARGVLPRWVQGRAVPGQIGKDVPLFLEWVSKRR
ncbi:hypothetical protein QBC47DRAFT_376604 [Echria macrotheca]|uniref:DUF3074 domain-containing protein n=1 Tax=Echria macrotheca TaxID=438768 RepID=A0AAJ0F868_9PEZI|nr:hypothetical protein QBC47DRAFT_376604 [Echria macrotheca]